MTVIFVHALTLAAPPLLSFSPFKIFVLAQAIQRGWRRALPLALTPLAADLPVIVLVLLVLRQLPDSAIQILRIAGGLFYFYLSRLLLRNASRPPAEIDAGKVPSHTFWQAVTAIWISPAVYINWTTVGVPGLLTYSQQAVWRGIAFLLFFYLMWIGGLAAQIVLFGGAGRISAGANSWLLRLAALLLVGFGAYQIWLGINGLMR